MLGGMEEDEEVVEEGGPGGMRQGGGGEQQPPQLVQDRGAAVLLALPYGFMAAELLFDTVVNSGTKSIQGPLTEMRGSSTTRGERGSEDQRALTALPITTSHC